MIRFPFNEVEGLICDEDKQTLRTLAAQCEVLPGVFVELGSYKGMSALCILSAASTAEIFCFDTFEDALMDSFIGNIWNAAVSDKVHMVIGNIRNELPTFDRDVSFAFVDHDHTKDLTVFSYEHLWPRMVSGGLLLFHDFRHEVYNEPTEYLESLPNRYLVSGGIIAFQKP